MRSVENEYRWIKIFAQLELAETVKDRGASSVLPSAVTKDGFQLAATRLEDEKAAPEGGV
jgi:hypothetical protein